MWNYLIALLFGQKLTIMVTGDVLTARSINVRAEQTGNFRYPIENLSSMFKSADAVLINLENPLVDNCPLVNDGMIFCGDPKFATALKDSGVTEVNIANNHMGNYGETGIQSTKKILKSVGLGIVGQGVIDYKNIKGEEVAFLGFNTIGEQPMITDSISQAAKKANLVIVEFHWGDEYTATPTAKQREYARQAIDAGADLVVGNHPHWVQSFETYKGKMIAYSHGNTVFDQFWSEETRKGIIGKYVFVGDSLVSRQFIPTYITSSGQATVIRN